MTVVTAMTVMIVGGTDERENRGRGMKNQRGKGQKSGIEETGTTEGTEMKGLVEMNAEKTEDEVKEMAGTEERTMEERNGEERIVQERKENLENQQGKRERNRGQRSTANRSNRQQNRRLQLLPLPQLQHNSSRQLQLLPQRLQATGF